MEIVKFVLNPLQENTYLVWDSTGECVIIDAGNASAKEDRMLSDFIAEKGEYRREYSQKEDRYWYSTTCACCGRWIILRMEPSY